MSIKRNLESIAILFILIIIITPIVDKLDLSQFYPLTELYTVFGVILAGIVYVYLQKNSSEWDMIDNLASAILLFAIVEQLLQWQVFQYNQTLWPCVCKVISVSVLIRMIIKEIKQTKNVANKNETIIELHEILGKKTEQDSEKLFELKERFANQVDENGKLPLISFRENTKDIDDQLNRKDFVNDIVQALKGVHSNSDDSFAIALTGKWGSGKTTVIESVKAEMKAEKIIIIDDISFWEYENKQALLKAIIERILQEADVLNIFERQIFTQLVLETIGEKLGIKLQSFLNSTWDLKKYKARIGVALVKKQQRIIVLIDDLERTNSAIAVMIFKVIATMLNIQNVVYLFCYDEEEMQGHFQSENINFDYVDKIINQKFTLPKISEKKMDDLTRRILKQLAEFYGREEAFEKIIDEKFELWLPTENIRDLKRMFNSLMPYIQKNELGLNERDRLLINYIKFKDNGLWYMLAENGNYLADFYDIDSRQSIKKIDHSVSKGFNPDKETAFEKERTAWITKLTSTYPQYIDVLNSLFNNFEIPDDYSIKNESDRQINILNGRYFLNYFNEESSEIIQMKIAINQCLSEKNIAEITITDEVEKQAVKELFEQNANQQNAMFLYLNQQYAHFQFFNVVIFRFLMDADFDKSNYSNAFLQMTEYCAVVMFSYVDSRALETILTKTGNSFSDFYFHKQVGEWLNSEEWQRQQRAVTPEETTEIITQYHENVQKQFLQVWENENITEQNFEAMCKIYANKEPDFYNEKNEQEWQEWFENRKNEDNNGIFSKWVYR